MGEPAEGNHGEPRRPIEWTRDDGLRKAARWLAEVRCGGTVRWGSSAQLTADGLLYRAPRLIGRGPETVLPYSPNLSWSIAGGFLAVADGDKTVTTLACNEPNFYPGLVAFD